MVTLLSTEVDIGIGTCNHRTRTRKLQILFNQIRTVIHIGLILKNSALRNAKILCHDFLNFLYLYFLGELLLAPVHCLLLANISDRGQSGDVCTANDLCPTQCSSRASFVYSTLDIGISQPEITQ